MAIPISNVTRRVVYAASGTGPYAFSFEILANTDIAVYEDDTLLELTTDYSVTINANGTGSITLVSSPTGDQIAIVGNRTISRTTDFTTGGDFFANTLNDELDQQTIFAQQNQEGLQRALSAPQTDPTTIDMTLPRASQRALKFLTFDASGNPLAGDVVGSNRGNWASGTLYYVRDIVKDTSNSNVYQCITEHTSSGSQPISSNADVAKWTLLVDAASAGASASAAAASAAAAALSAGNAEAAQTAAEAAQGLAETAQAAAEASETAAALSEAAAAASEAAAGNSEAAAEAIFANFNNAYLGAKSSDPTVDNDGNALTDGDLYFDTTNNVMKVYDLGTTTWFQLTPTLSNQTAINTVAGNIDAVITVANDLNEAVSEIEVVAANIALIDQVGGNMDSIVAVGGNIDSVITVATNISDVNNFADVYIGASATAPSTRADGSALQVGDLYFNTSDNQMKVYDGSAWGSVGSTVNGTSQRYRYIATSSQTTFTGADSNGNTLAYDSGFIDVYLNGVRLDQTDYTATSGTSVVLNVGATADDELNIVAYGNFELADVYTKVQSDARYYTQTESDARYYTQSQVDTEISNATSSLASTGKAIAMAIVFG